MTNVEVSVDRRRDQRFVVCEQAIAVIKIGDRSTRVGRVVDISRGGLSFDYVLVDGGATESGAADDTAGSAFLNILTGKGCVALRDVLIQTVSDRLLEQQEPSFTSLPLRRCGVSFNGLSQEQQTELGEFLVRNAISHELGAETLTS